MFPRLRSCANGLLVAMLCFVYAATGFAAELQRAIVCQSRQGSGDPWPGYARFQATPDGQIGKRAVIPLRHPFARFFAATERGGSHASYTLDVYGTDWGERTLRYSRVHIAPKR